ncbi:MAG TPA: hypothetical protein VGH23_22085 [Rhizomicrobium sp.]|jgi:hypothetical protein
MAEVRLQGYRFQLEHPQSGDDKEELERAARELEERVGITKNLQMAKSQIFFGLAGYAIEQYLATQEGLKLQAANALLNYLPNDLPTLVPLFESVADDRASDFWGWGWWDLQADGEAHFVDTFTRPNRTFIVRALQVLASAGAPPAAPAIDDDMTFAFAENNGQGVPTTLNEIVEQWDRYGGILGEAEQNQIDALRTLFDQMKRAGEDVSEARLRAAPLDHEKVQKFKETVAESFGKSSRLREIFARFSKVTERFNDPPPEGLLAWGYNQLDDKGAFIANWHVAYPSWGESYGRGLAQAESERAFGEMIERAAMRAEATEAGVIGAIVHQVRQRKDWHKPIILETLSHALEYSHMKGHEHFEPRYSRDLPSMEEAKIDGFRGIIKVGSMHIPMFRIHDRNANHVDKVLIAELDHFAEWERYGPTDRGDQLGDVYRHLLIKVFDLNTDDERRNKIIAENPPWLAEHGNEQAQRELFLRAKVVVNVYDRYRLKFLDDAEAACITVTSDHQSPQE